MHFLTKLFGGEKKPVTTRPRLSPDEQTAMDDLLKKAKAQAENTDPTGNQRLRLTPEGHIDARGELAGAGNIAPAIKKTTYVDDLVSRHELNLTREGYVDATGELAGAGTISQEMKKATYADDLAGRHELNLTHEGHVSVYGYEPDAGTQEILNKFRAAQANERINGAPTEQQTGPKKTVQATTTGPGMKNDIL